ncbi:MAG: tripartite tricarboxylate transporter substrate binding protein [Rubrivivax sp.]|nr:tripartite tricarboxylate transporter substrate binding protein [Rubrivivax sp.]
MDRRRFTALAAGTLAATALPPARAQAWPGKPIKVLQGFAAGGNADTIARLVSTEMAKGLGQPFVVEAVVGAGGTLASAAVARAAPDGYTLLLATGGHAVAGALYEKLPYPSVAGFQMVSTITFFPFLVVTTAESRYRSLTEVLAAARAQANAISYGTAGVGSTHHLVGELMAKMAGVQMLHVPYRGDSASLTALLAGDIPIIIAPPTAVLGNLKAGKLRALAVTGPRRWAGMPEVPTVAEQGVAGFDVSSWAGWMLPAGTPMPIVERLHAETQKALQVPAVRARLEEMGGEARGSTPQEMAAMVAAEVQKWTQVVTDAKIPRL